MPYRRLPNTDQARMRAINGAINQASEANFNDQVIAFRTLNEARNFISQFESQVSRYHQTTTSKISANKEYKHIVNNARMYISHFIQILNMAIARGEIKADDRKFYELPLDSSRVPDLTTEEDLLYWGEKIIAGEFKRTNNGMKGYKLMNPTIALVQVHYDIFKDKQASHSIRRTSYNRTIDEMTDLRIKADAIILDIWNQVEEYYRDCKPYDRLCKCQAYGLIYYYRTGEKKLTPETDKAIEEEVARTLKIEFE